MSSARNLDRRNLLGIGAVGMAGLTTAGLFRHSFSAPAAPGVKGPVRDLFKPRQWFNTEPLQPAAVAGHVILVNFWTYSCINSLRMLPYLEAWSRKYAPAGLKVIGVHTPEFTFEKNPAHVRQAVTDVGVTYPVAMDSDYGTWNAFNNDAWPAIYFIDAKGDIRRHVDGEGGYDDLERLVQSLLAESGKTVDRGLSAVAGKGTQADPDFAELNSPETYLGYAKATGVTTRPNILPEISRRYTAVESLSLNQWTFDGPWTVKSEFAQSDGPAAVAFRMQARDMHMVLSPVTADQRIRFRVTIDGQAPGADHGTDTDTNGYGLVDRPRLYQLVRQSRRVTERIVRVEFLGPGLQAYSYTFG